MNNCRACDYFSMPKYGGHCYMFKEEPFQCLCFKEPRDKGMLNGRCNLTDCGQCGPMLNRENYRSAHEILGHDLCTPTEGKSP